MIVTLIVVCEVAFWVLLAVGLALRYWAKRPRASVVVLLCEPLLEVLLFVIAAIDLKNGAEPGPRHGIAAVYIGFSLALGPSLVRWADARVAHRFAGGPPPSTPRYGWPRAVHEWRVAARWTVGSLIAMALLQCAIWYVGRAGATQVLSDWQRGMLYLIGINLVIALSYTFFPKKAPAGRTEQPPPAPTVDRGPFDKRL
ncbi:hypothetical protein [Streptomyces sp. NPDC058045]|uniref:hypothetical protein n=1 Tax=Streptomyces sp. NPDC058045 TaxID=3346311 RepID=UPI0036EA409D